MSAVSPAAHTVVMATDSADPSGVGRHMLTLACALPGDWRARVLFADHVPGRALAAEGRRRGLQTATVAGTGWDHALRGADIVHVHAGIGWEGHRLVAAATAPVVRTEHLPWLITCPQQRADYACMIAGVAALIAVSDAAAETWAPVLDAMAGPRPPLACIPNGIDPPPATAPSRAEAVPPVILCVARLTAQKNHRTLIAAMARLSRSHPQARLHLVGSGPEQSRIRRRAARHGLDVAFLGPRDDVPVLMAAAALLVLPSTFEGLPLVVLEAMAQHLPVIATRIGGVTEALGPDHPWLVPPGDARALAATLAAALDDPDARAATALSQRARYDAFYTATRMGEDTARLYAAVLRGQRQRTTPNDHHTAGLYRRGGHRPPAFRRAGTDARRADRGGGRP